MSTSYVKQNEFDIFNEMSNLVIPTMAFVIAVIIVDIIKESFEEGCGMTGLSVSLIGFAIVIVVTLPLLYFMFSARRRRRHNVHPQTIGNIYNIV